MKSLKSFNPLIYTWLLLALYICGPVLLNNVSLFVRGWSMSKMTPDEGAFLILIIGGIVYVSGFVLIAFKRVIGVWLLFLALPVFYALTLLFFALVGIFDADKEGMGFIFYVALPQLLNLVTVGILFLRKEGISGWRVLKAKGMIICQSPV